MDISISLCQCERLARGLPSFQGRDRDGRTKKLQSPESLTAKPIHPLYSHFQRLEILRIHARLSHQRNFSGAGNFT
jgi:hypothetical protein